MDYQNNEIIRSFGTQSFEHLKQINEFGAEFWCARDLQSLLGYSQWRRFEQAIKRAINSCKESGNNPTYHFAGAGKMVKIGSSSSRKLQDFHLSRFVCYLAANQFRLTQAREKLTRERIHDQKQAIYAHEQVGKEVREAIKRIGGDLPENIPAAEHIKSVKKRVKSSIPKLELEHHDAGGL